jgi:lysophospholipase L1-like esterase
VKYSVNPYGYLYPIKHHKRKSTHEIRIAAVGGSTVECIALQPEKRWPHLVQTRLAQKFGNRMVTVLNLGISGQATPTHMATVVQHAVKLDLDAIVFMLGANDLRRAAQDWQQLLGPTNFHRTEVNRVHMMRLLVTRVQLGRRIHTFWQGLPQTSTPATRLRTRPYFSKIAGWRQKLPLLKIDPHISASALADYGKNIVSLVGVARAHGIRVLLTTQPMLWKKRFSAQESAVDWLGVYQLDGQSFRLRPETSARLLQTLNQQLVMVSQARGYRYLDLAQRIEPSLDNFYDCIHFNEQGAHKVAEMIADALYPILKRGA